MQHLVCWCSGADIRSRHLQTDESQAFASHGDKRVTVNGAHLARYAPQFLRPWPRRTVVSRETNDFSAAIDGEVVRKDLLHFAPCLTVTRDNQAADCPPACV